MQANDSRGKKKISLTIYAFELIRFEVESHDLNCYLFVFEDY